MSEKMSVTMFKKPWVKDISIEFRSNIPALFGLFLIFLLFFSAIFVTIDSTFFDRKIISTLIADPLEMTPDTYQPPSKDHWFGTDEFGRDILARVIYGSQTAVIVGISSVGFSFVFGVLIGAIAGFYGGKVDHVLMRMVEVLYSIPALAFALFIVAIFGANIQNVVIAVGIINMPKFARVIRSEVLSIKEREFVMAARALGLKNSRIIMDHVIPNAITSALVVATLSIGTAILDVAALSFLGFGVQPPTISWGLMLSSGREALFIDPYLAFFPGLAIFLTAMSFNLVGDAVRDAFDPKLKTRWNR
jgi:peptide/nickel transport system permease protein